jgi:hypothetical protein
MAVTGRIDLARVVMWEYARRQIEHLEGAFEGFRQRTTSALSAASLPTLYSSAKASTPPQTARES